MAQLNQRYTPAIIVVLLISLFNIFIFPGFRTNPPYLPDISESDIRTFASNAINNTVVIVPVNKGMLHLAENLVCSLKQTSFDTTKIVFWTLDREAQDILNRAGRATYLDPNLYGVPNNENIRGNTKAYNRMMKERPKFFISMLKTGYDILMLDADTVFWQSPLSMLLPSDKANGVDIVFSTDARLFYQSHNAFRDERRRGALMPPVCNGIFWMRSNSRTIGLWMKMLEVFHERGPLGWYHRINFQDDQRGMDVLLNDGRAQLVDPFPDGITANLLPRLGRGKHDLRVRLLDQTQVANGHLLRYHAQEYQRNLARLHEQGQDRIAAHFNWDTTTLSKEGGAQEYGMYFLDANNQCKHA